MPTGYTAVSATNLCDATGTVITNATISFKPVDNEGNSISFRAGGTSEGQASSQPVSTTVTNGAFTIQLADTTLTTPKNVGYTVTVTDNLTGDCLLGPAGYICVQPSGATWSFDTYDPNYAAQITVQAGPSGKDGQGFANRGAWAVNTAYKPYDVLTYADTTYLASASFTSGGTFDATNLQVLVTTDVEPDGSVLTVKDKNDNAITLYSISGGKVVSNLYESRVSALESEFVAVPVAGGGNVIGFKGDSPDYLLPIVDLDGNITRPSTQSASNLDHAIAAMNAHCTSYSQSLSRKYNLLGTGLVYDYNIIILDGQSLMSGYQAVGVYSTAANGYPHHNNKGIGQFSRWAYQAYSPYPVGDNNFDPLVEGNGSCESPTSGCANMLKDYLNTSEHVLESGKTLVVTNIASPGTTIEQHLPGGPIYPDGGTENLWATVQRAFTLLKAAVPTGKTVGIVAVWWGQGEFNVGDTAAAYTANLVTLRAAYDALAVSTFGQTQQASWFLTQIGGGFLNDGSPGVMHAELNYAAQTPHTYCVGSYYHIVNLGNGHRTGNGYRWLGTQGGRVMGQVLALRKPFEPLKPIKVQWVGNTLVVGFHVPVGPLQARPVYFSNVPTNYPDLGFNLFDAQGYIACTVSIAADSVVTLTPNRVVDQATAVLHYADVGNEGGGAVVHNGMGNLADSNTLECEDIYVAPDLDSVPAGGGAGANGMPAGTNYDIAGLTGLPYPQNNFCVAFQLTTSTFNGTF